jgi:hypothetical protein
VGEMKLNAPENSQEKINIFSAMLFAHCIIPGKIWRNFQSSCLPSSDGLNVLNRL